MGYKVTKQMEIEANYFARCLLMPKQLVIEEIEKYKDKFHSFEALTFKLAEIFQVEQEVMRFRIQELNLMDYGL